MKRYLFMITLLLSFLNCLGQSADAVIRGLEKAASEGDISAQLHLGNCYFNGTLGCKKNLAKAKQYYQLAAKRGDPEAQYKLAKLLRSAGLNTQGEAEVFFGYLQASADNGYSPAQYACGLELLQIKMPEAFKYLKLAADNGEIDAVYPLGICYLEGIGCHTDYNAAISCFSRGKESVPEDEFVMDMSHCYVKLRNFTKAKEYLERGVNLGLPGAYQTLSVMSMTGDGMRKDFKEALKLINIAIEKDPSCPNYKDIKGSILLELGRPVEARDIWEDLLHHNKEYANSSQTDFCKLMRKGVEGNVDMDIYKTSTINENTYVVIISNENYRREESVPYALNDGNIFKLYCQNTLGIPAKNINHLPDATFNDIRYGINWLEKIAQASKGNAKIIFYYAGHGIPSDDMTNSYLLPTDGYGYDIQTGYELKELYRKLADVNASQIVVILDACFSGARRDCGMLVSSRGVAIKAKQTEPLRNMVVLSAAQGNETAYAYKKKKHGMFTYYVLKKLQESKGNTTLGDLFRYVQSQVAKQSVLENGKSQTPTVISGINTGWESIVLK